jgi:hypothetical protein
MRLIGERIRKPQPDFSDLTIPAGGFDHQHAECFVDLLYYTIAFKSFEVLHIFSIVTQVDIII